MATPGEKILVVDDDSINRNVLGVMLRKAGFEVTFACDGHEALGAAARAAPDLVLLDYMMPGLSGPEVLARLRSEVATKDVPVLLVTASSEDAHIEAGLRAGADDYLVKPIDPRILRARVSSALRASQDRRRAEAAARAAQEHQQVIDDLGDAREVQRAELPRLPLRWEGWRADGAVVPANGSVGGDIFDIVEVAGGRRVALLLDVCGHGLGAALVAAGVRAELRALLRLRSLGDAFTELNARMVEQGVPRYTCVAAVELGREEIAVVNAGLPAVCVGGDGALIAEIASFGAPLGMFPGEVYGPRTVRVAPGQRVILMSDGLVEPFGMPDDVSPTVRALTVFDPHAWRDGDPTTAEERVRQRVAEAPEAFRDDATLLLIEATGERAPREALPEIGTRLPGPPPGGGRGARQMP